MACFRSNLTSMCGRMVALALKRFLFEEGNGRTIRDLVDNYVDRYNLAPTQGAVTIHQVDGAWEATSRKWGLVPSWSKDESVGARLINARSETVQEKPSFRSAFKRNRLLIPVSGFYEWAVIAGKKRPFFIHPANGGHWFFAGLGESWKGPAGLVESFTVLTTDANQALVELHHRMPVILGPSQLDTWLDPNASPDALQALLSPCPEQWVDAYEVGAAVGNVRNDAPDLIEPLKA